MTDRVYVVSNIYVQRDRFKCSPFSIIFPHLEVWKLKAHVINAFRTIADVNYVRCFGQRIMSSGLRGHYNLFPDFNTLEQFKYIVVCCLEVIIIQIMNRKV